MRLRPSHSSSRRVMWSKPAMCRSRLGAQLEEPQVREAAHALDLQRIRGAVSGVGVASGV